RAAGGRRRAPPPPGGGRGRGRRAPPSPPPRCPARPSPAPPDPVPRFVAVAESAGRPVHLTGRSGWSVATAGILPGCMADRGGSARTRAAAALLVAGLAVALAGCSGAPAATPLASTTFAAPTEVPTPVPTPTGTAPTEAPTPALTSGSGTSACGAADLKASHDLVEGAAGSRLTTLVLNSAARCSVDRYPAVGIRDANGTELVGSTLTGVGRIDLDPNTSYSSDVRFANWCNPAPRFPLQLVLRIGAEA